MSLAGFEHSFKQKNIQMWVGLSECLKKISSETRSVNPLIFVHNKSHDLKNLFALSQGNMYFDQVCKV